MKTFARGFLRYLASYFAVIFVIMFMPVFLLIQDMTIFDSIMNFVFSNKN